MNDININNSDYLNFVLNLINLSDKILDKFSKNEEQTTNQSNCVVSNEAEHVPYKVMIIDVDLSREKMVRSVPGKSALLFSQEEQYHDDFYAR